MLNDQRNRIFLFVIMQLTTQTIEISYVAAIMQLTTQTIAATIIIIITIRLV